MCLSARANSYLFSGTTLRRIGVIEGIHKYIQKQPTGTCLYKALTLSGKKAQSSVCDLILFSSYLSVLIVNSMQ